MAQVQLPQLTGDNFSNWKFRVLAILDEKRVKEVIEQEIDNETASEKEKENFQMRDSKAKSTIIQCVTDKYLEYIKDAKTAKQMISSLQNVFERKSIFSKLYLKKKLLTMKFTNGSLDEHFVKFETLVREIEVTGAMMDDSDKVCHLLLTMPEKYDTVITAIETMTSNITLEFVKSRLLDAELKLLNSKEETCSSNEVSFRADRNFPFECYGCGQKGHKKEDCPKRYRNNSRGTNNRRSFRRRGSNFTRGSGQYHQQANQATQEGEEMSFIALNTYNEFKEDSIVTFIIDSGATQHLVKEDLESLMKDVENLESEISIHIADGKTITAKKKGKLKFNYEGKIITMEALIVPKLSHNLLSVSKLTSNGKELIFTNKGVKIKGEGKEVISEMKGQLYTINFNTEKESKEFCNLANNDIWHRRLGHLNRKCLKILNLPYSKENCDSCMQGKATRLPFKHISCPKTKRIGELLHTDLCGPFKTPTGNGERYFQTVTDDYSHFTVVYLLKNKYEAAGNLIQYIKELKARFGNKTARIRCDNGGEFSSRYFKNFCRSKGIRMEYTIHYTPQQNGVSERMNRTLLDKVRTMFVETDLPKHLWGEAIRTATYQLNRSPTTALRYDVPAKIWHGKTDLFKLRVFGSKAWTYNLPKAGKLEPRAKHMKMIGYCDNGYRLWDPEEDRIIVARDVKFDENATKYVEEKECNEKRENKYKETKIYEKEVEIIETEKEENAEDEETQRKSKRNIKLPARLEDYELYSAYCFITSDDPITYNEAIEKGSEWKEAIDKELEAHKKLGTWIPTERLPDDKKAIDTKWIFKTKENGIKKARLVARGFQEECDFNVYAPVARISTIRMLIIYALQNNLTIRQLDIPTAFLNGYLKNDIYIKAPDGLKTEREKIFKLQRALYGLKEASKSWNDRFNVFATQNGFERSKNDFCLYVSSTTLMLIYVDDILLIGENVEAVVKLLMKEFNATDLGNISKFLGMEVQRESNLIRISQKGMIDKILIKFNMLDCNGVKTPMETNFDISSSSEKVNVPYRQLIGCLMYLSVISRPDITFAVSFLSQFLDKPDDQMWKAAKRIVRYLKETRDLKLTYSKSIDNHQLCIYTDADWAGNKTDRKSTSGAIAYYLGNPVLWLSRKQRTVALSTAEAEYIAAATAASELMSLKGVLSDINRNKELDDAIIFIDNKSAISMIDSYENSKRCKHIDIRHHFIKDLISKNIIKVQYTPTKENVADCFTKALSREIFNKFRDRIKII